MNKQVKFNIDNSFVINLRHYLGITQEDFANSLNININTIRMIEQKRRNVSKSVQKAILEKYSQFVKNNEIQSFENLREKKLLLHPDIKAIWNLCEYYEISQAQLSNRIKISRQTLNEILNVKNNRKLPAHIKTAIENIYGNLTFYYDNIQISVTERFIYARVEIANKTQKQFAEKLGIPLPRLKDIENHKKGITEKIVKILEDEYLIRPEWLLENKGCPTKLDEIEAEEYKDNIDTENNNVQIPFYSVKAAAGYGEPIPDYPEHDIIHFDKRWLTNVIGIKPENATIIQAKGNSMDGGSNPIKNDDLLMIDISQTTPVNNQIFVIRIHNNQDLVVKRIILEWNGGVKLKSDNPSFADIIPEAEDVIIGKVVWNASRKNV